jgi:hypothetical protein
MNQKMIIDLHIPVNKNIEFYFFINVAITLLHLIVRKLNWFFFSHMWLHMKWTKKTYL